MEALLTTLANRPSTVANVVAFLILATAERGALRAAIWLVTGTALAWLSEASSIRTGVPYGLYFYHAESFAGEPSLAGVPIFASLSIASLTYFGYSAAWTLLSPLRGRGARIERAPDGALPHSWRVLWLAALVVMWLDLVMDPVTLLGRYWHLGDLYHYAESGMHFGVPLTNYAGWFLTAFAIVFVNQTISRMLERVAPPRTIALPYGPFLGIASQLGTYVYMLGAATYLTLLAEVPSDVPVSAILASTVLFTAAYLIFVVTTIRNPGILATEASATLR
jgi:uncharacterized membrane protein